LFSLGSGAGKEQQAFLGKRPAVTLPSLFLLVFLFYLNYFTTLIKTTIGANDMRQDHRATIRTGHQVGDFQGIMGTPSVTASFGEFPFRLWGHDDSFF
jgi:hypothetical protein